MSKINMNVLETKNLNKEFNGKLAVNDVNMTIKKGQIYGLVGKNGAGKTTLMRLVLGLAFQNSGEISLFEKTGSERLKYKKHIGALIEQPTFYDNMTAYQNLDIHRTLCGVAGKEIIDEVLKIVNLEHTGDKTAKSFSLGMKQRLGIAQSLINSPEFLILDEPVNGLDPEGVKEIRDTLLKLVEEKNTTILISSHILGELSLLATHYGFMSNGKLIEEISAEELHEKCKQSLILEVSDVDKTTVILEKDFRIKNYRVVSNTKIEISEGLEISAQINKKIINSGIELVSSSVYEKTLEEYFLEITGGNENV